MMLQALVASALSCTPAPSNIEFFDKDGTRLPNFSMTPPVCTMMIEGIELRRQRGEFSVETISAPDQVGQTVSGAVLVYTLRHVSVFMNSATETSIDVEVFECAERKDIALIGEHGERIKGAGLGRGLGPPGAEQRRALTAYFALPASSLGPRTTPAIFTLIDRRARCQSELSIPAAYFNALDAYQRLSVEATDQSKRGAAQ